MIKLVSLALQLFLLNKSVAKQASLFQHLECAADKAKVYFLFGVGSFVSLLFLIISIVVGVIGIGLQIDKQGVITFSGLIISAAIFGLVSMLTFIISLCILVYQKNIIKKNELAKEQEAAANFFSPIFNNILKTVLDNFSKPKEDKK